MPGESLRLLRMARLCSGRTRVLDVGCADLPNPFLDNPELVGLDLQRGIELPANYSGYIVGDVMEMAEHAGAASFDAVHAGEIIEHLEHPLDFLRAVHATLRPGGIVVLSTPNPNSPIERFLTLFLTRRFFYGKGGRYEPFGHIMLFPQRWLVRMLEVAGFGDVRLFSGGFPTGVIGLVPFPRPWCYQTIAVATKLA